MHRLGILAFGLAALLGAGAALAQKDCSKADEAAAMKATDRVASWATLHAAWKSYRHCDSGAVADAFTEALLRLIIDWKHVEQLASAMKDAEYEQFVIAHLRSDAAKADVEDVYSRAKASCPKTLTSWCASLAAAVDSAPPKPIVAEPAAPAPAPGKK